MARTARTLLLAGCAGWALAASCRPPTPATRCVEQGDCPAGTRCDSDRGYCVVQPGTDAGGAVDVQGAEQLPVDAAQQDTGPAADTALPDRSPSDTSPRSDAAAPDASTPDRSIPDAALPDTSLPDTWRSPWLIEHLGRRIRLTLRNDFAGAEALDNLPVLVSLDSAHYSAAELAELLGPDAALTFVTEGDQVLPYEVLPYEVDSSVEGSALRLWVPSPAVPAGSSQVSIWLYYLDQTGAGPLSPGSRPVWDADYAGVWHLETPAGSTDPATDLTPRGASPADGRIGGAYYMPGDGSGLDLIRAPAALHITGNLTISAWVNIEELQGEQYSNTIVVGGRPISNLYFMSVTPDRRLLAYWSASPEPVEQSTASAGVVATGTWQHVAVTRDVDALELRFFLGGTMLDVPFPFSGTTLSVNNHGLWLGYDPRSAAVWFLKGYLDEIRISGKVRSPGWIAASVRSATGEFVEHGPVEQR